eukprot:13520_1
MALFTTFYIILLAVNYGIKQCQSTDFKTLTDYVEWIDDPDVQKQLVYYADTIPIDVPDELRNHGSARGPLKKVLVLSSRPSAGHEKHENIGGSRTDYPIQFKMDYVPRDRALYVFFLATSRREDYLTSMEWGYESTALSFKEGIHDWSELEGLSFKKGIHDKLYDALFNEQFIGVLNEIIFEKGVSQISKLVLSGHSLGAVYAQAIGLLMHLDDLNLPPSIVLLKSLLVVPKSVIRDMHGSVSKLSINDDNKDKLLIITTGAYLFVKSDQSLEPFATDRFFNFIQGQDPVPMVFGGPAMIIGNDYYVIDSLVKETGSTLAKLASKTPFKKKTVEILSVKIRKLIDGESIGYKGFNYLTEHLKVGSKWRFQKSPSFAHHNTYSMLLTWWLPRHRAAPAAPAESAESIAHRISEERRKRYKLDLADLRSIAPTSRSVDQKRRIRILTALTGLLSVDPEDRTDDQISEIRAFEQKLEPKLEDETSGASGASGASGTSEEDILAGTRYRKKVGHKEGKDSEFKAHSFFGDVLSVDIENDRISFMDIPLFLMQFPIFNAILFILCTLCCCFGGLFGYFMDTIHAICAYRRSRNKLNDKVT